jgi:hypothetical protein
LIPPDLPFRAWEGLIEPNTLNEVSIKRREFNQSIVRAVKLDRLTRTAGAESLPIDVFFTATWARFNNGLEVLDE